MWSGREVGRSGQRLPAWARWSAGVGPWTLGVEEELILVDAGTGAAANRISAVLAGAGDDLRAHLAAETHACVLELRTDPARTVRGLTAQLGQLRHALDRSLLHEHGLRAAAAGTHPLLARADVAVTPQPRYREIERTMHALARREPTMGLHVHVGVPNGDAAVRAFDGLRAHVPTLIALSANSPYWAGEDSGFASFRTPLLSMFPRMGLPQSFGDYASWVAAIDALVTAGAIPDPSFVWWDLRVQPRLGTIEVRAMDAQTRVVDTAALVAVVQCLVRRLVEGPLRPQPPPEVLAENRFLAARDGMAAQVVDVDRGVRVPMLDVVERLLEECRPVAAALGCRAELAAAGHLADEPGDLRQRRFARRHGLAALPAHLATEFGMAAPAAIATTA